MELRKFFIAKNGWQAKKILAKIKKGELNPDSVLFDTSKEAIRRLNHMQPLKARLFSIFQIQWKG